MTSRVAIGGVGAFSLPPNLPDWAFALVIFARKYCRYNFLKRMDRYSDWNLFAKCSAGGFSFHFGEFLECPARGLKVDGSIPANVILKCGARGPGVETRLEPKFFFLIDALFGRGPRFFICGCDSRLGGNGGCGGF